MTTLSDAMQSDADPHHGAGAADAMVHDPVCGMSVDPAAAMGALMSEDRQNRFADLLVVSAIDLPTVGNNTSSGNGSLARRHRDRGGIGCDSGPKRLDLSAHGPRIY
jgi:hypothetical protein